MDQATNKVSEDLPLFVQIIFFMRYSQLTNKTHTWMEELLL